MTRPASSARALTQARRLRTTETPAERALWRALRSRRPHWRRQAPVGDFIADFACLSARLLVELDGGAHDFEPAQLRDAQRDSALKAMGFDTLRFSNADALNAAEALAAMLEREALLRLPPWKRRALLQAQAETRTPMQEMGSPSPTGGGVGVGGPEVLPNVSPSNLDVETASSASPPSPTPPLVGEGRRSTVGVNGKKDRRPSRRTTLVSDPGGRSSGGPPSGPMILVGAVTGAHGIQGELRVKPFTAAPESVAAYGPLYAKDGRLLLTPARVRVLKDAVALAGPEVKDRTAAEALKGEGLYVPRAALPAPTEDDEILVADLIGRAVRHVDGRPLGRIADVRNFGAGDLLEIEPPTGPRWLLPFTKENAPIVTPDDFALDPPAGLEPEPPEQAP